VGYRAKRDRSPPGPHPSLLQLASALHLGRRYLAAVSVGLSVYAVFASQRWFAVSPRKTLRTATAFMGLLYFLPTFLLRDSGMFATLMLISRSRHNLSYLPSNHGIALHLAIAAAFIAATGFTLREVEL